MNTQTKLIASVMEACEDRPHGTEADEFDATIGAYHWQLDTILPDAVIVEDNGEDLLWVLNGVYVAWINSDRGYTIVPGPDNWLAVARGVA